MSSSPQPIDVNTAFAAERAEQLLTFAARKADFDQRLADGRLVALGGGRYRINDPASWDNGETWVQQPDGLLIPQHGLDTSRGQAALYSAVPAWHKLGNVIPGGTTDIDEVLALGGIDFDVERRPVQFRLTPHDELRTLSDRFVTVRNDTGAGLGVVGSKYEVFQSRHLFRFLQELVDRYDVVWESAGALRGGRRVFICLRLPNSIIIDRSGIADEIVPFIVAVNTFDGSSLFYVVVTPWRPLCGNTERLALQEALSRWGIRHTRNGLDRLEEARRTLGLSVKYFEQFAAEEESLARTELALAEFRELVDHLWEPPADDASALAKTRHLKRVEVLTELYNTNAEKLGNTAYAGERAITEFADWKKGIRPSGSLRGDNLAARATAVMEGTNDDLKSRAHRRLLTLTHR